MMEFEIQFTIFFFRSLAFMSPTLLGLVVLISGLGLWVGRMEDWSLTDSLYYAFITATTVGYGDLHPVGKRSRLLAIVIAFVGILFTGLVVALAVTSASYAFEVTHDMDALKEAYRRKHG